MDLNYLRQRRQEELLCAESAATPESGKVHRELADRYADLIRLKQETAKIPAV